jgi:hypothetical protein
MYYAIYSELLNYFFLFNYTGFMYSKQVFSIDHIGYELYDLCKK